MIVKDEELKRKIISALTDDYSRRILLATVAGMRSAADLSRECNIPIATVYRRIEELVDIGLLAAVKSGRTEDGKWYELYRSAVRGLTIRFESAALELDLDVPTDLSLKFAKLWSLMRQTPS